MPESDSMPVLRLSGKPVYWVWWRIAAPIVLENSLILFSATVVPLRHVAAAQISFAAALLPRRAARIHPIAFYAVPAFANYCASID